MFETDTNTDYTLTARELSAIRTVLGIEESYGPTKTLSMGEMSGYFENLNALSGVYRSIANQMFSAWVRQYFTRLTATSDTLAEMYLVWQYQNGLHGYNADNAYFPPGTKLPPSDWTNAPWVSYWHVFRGYYFGWYVPWPTDNGSYIVSRPAMSIPGAPTVWHSKVQSIASSWGDTPPAHLVNVGKTIGSYGECAKFEQGVLDGWTDFPKVIATTSPVWQAQATALANLIGSSDPLTSADYFFLLHLLIAVSTGTQQDQSSVDKVVSAVASSMEYPNDSVGNQLIYLALMYLANPLGDFAWNNGQLQRFLSDTENAIKSSSAGAQALKTSMAKHLKILVVDAAYPMQDPYNPNIGFNTRISDTLNALEAARKGLEDSLSSLGRTNTTVDCSLTEKDNTGKDFSNCDFSGKDLSGYTFAGCTLTGTNFSECTFNASTDFAGAIFGLSSSFKTTNFSECDLTLANFSQPARFGGVGQHGYWTDLTKATIPWTLLGSQIQYVDLTDATFTGMPSDLSQNMLMSVKWNGFDFGGRSLENTHFINCDLTDCVMTGVNLDYVSFVQVCDLTGVKMKGASLYYTVFDGSTMTNTDLSYATTLSNCSFLNTLLKGTKFDGNDLSNSKFSTPALLSSDPNYITSFQFATITTTFLITNLQKDWQCMDLRNVQVSGFSGIVDQLVNLNAKNSLFNNTLSFQSAELNGADFSGASFNGVNFQYAQMNNARFVDAQTLAGNEMGPDGAIFAVAQSDSSLEPPYDYDSFLSDLQTKNTDKITDVFAHYGYTIGNLTVTTTTDPVSHDPAWLVLDNLTNPAKTYMVVQAGESNEHTLLAFDNSPCRFSYAHLIGSYLQGANLSDSQMLQVQLYGATLTYGNLTNVNLTGAQLGKNAAVFSIAETNTSLQPPYDYTSFLTDLQTPYLANIIKVFQHNGYTIASISCAPTTPPSGAVAAWLVKDKGLTPERTFTVSQVPIKNTSPTKYELDVYFNEALPTILDYSYMPGITLSEANLTGCSAQNCHLYNDNQTSSSAVLNKTTLLEVRFTNSNLYKTDFSDATLLGANFTSANLMGANFKGVLLGPAESGHDVTFEDANLQGTSFSTATFRGANLLNAAVCLATPTDPNSTNGVWLYEVPIGNASLPAYLSELNAEAAQAITNPPPSILSTKFLIPGTIQTNLIGVLSGVGITVSATSTVSVAANQQTWKITDGTNVYLLIPEFDSNAYVAYGVYLEGAATPVCNLSYTTSLQAGTVPESLIQTLETNSDGQIDLSASAVLSTYLRPVVWMISDPTDGNSYTLWWGSQLVGNAPSNVTYVRSSIPNLISLFNKFQIGLRQQTFITKETDTTGNTTTWTVDMGTEDPFYLGTGYIRFKIVGDSATDVTELDIYGYTMRMSGMGNDETEVIQDFDCDITDIAADSMDDSTVMPNNLTKVQNTNQQLPFDVWMRYHQMYPTPPVCVPTGISYCPAQKPSNKAKDDGDTPPT